MDVKKILFPTDLSEGAEPAKAFAVRLAKKHGAEILFLHAVLPHDHDFRQLGELLNDFLVQLEREADSKLDEETSLLREEGCVAHHKVDRKSSAFNAIMENVETWHPDLIVMGTHGHRGLERWFLGSVAEKVVRHAPVPVVTVRPDDGTARTAAEITRILVPVDFSDNSRRAVALARGLVPADGTLMLHHVVMNPSLSGLAPELHLRLFSADPSLPERIRARMEEWMEGEPFEAEVTEADEVFQSILDLAKRKEADLIVIGTRGRTGVDYFLTGSVAEKIVRSSPIPVLTVK